MVSMRTDARVPVPRNTCAHACVGRFLMRARARVLAGDAHACTRIPRRQDAGVGGAPRTHTRACTGVNYASREMSNCSPYRKIYNSARCGKHYVLSRVLPLRPALPHGWPFPPSATQSLPPALALYHAVLPLLSRSRFPTPFARFANNKFARRTAIVLTSKRFQPFCFRKSIFPSLAI